MNKDNAIIKITDENIVEVTTVQETGKVTVVITFDDFCKRVLASKDQRTEKKELRVSPILPHSTQGDDTITINYLIDEVSGKEAVMLLRKSRKATINYYGDEYNVDLPHIVFAVTMLNGRVQTLKAAAIPSTVKVITDATPLFNYPLGHITPNSCCLGNNITTEFDFESISNVIGVPEMFLAMPESGHGINNKSGMEERVLLDYLTKNPFKDEFLSETKLTYGNWVKNSII